MNDLIIFGCSGFARIVHSLVEEAGLYRTVAFTVDAAHRAQDSFMDRPLWPFEELESHYPPGSDVEVLIAVGYSKMNEVRRQRYEGFKARGYRMGSYLCPRLHVPASATLGDHNLILDENSIQPYCRIGNNVVLWSRNVVGHESVIQDHCFLSSGAIVSGFATVGAGSFMAPHSLVMAGITLGQRVFLGPAAVADSDLPDESVLVSAKSVRRSLPSRRLPPF